MIIRALSASIVLLLLVPQSSPGADDPQRFMAVPEWVGSLRVLVRGSGVYRMAQYEYHHQANVLADMPLTLTGLPPGAPFFFTWTGCLENYVATWHSQVTNECPSGTTEVVTRGSGPFLQMGPPGCMKVDLNIFPPPFGDGTGSLALPTLFWDGEQTLRSDCPDTNEVYQIPVGIEVGGTNQALSEIPLPEVGLRIQVSWTFRDTFAHPEWGIPVEYDWQVDLDLSGEPEELEVVVEPLGDYPTWIPEAKNAEDEPANDISFIARLRRKGGGIARRRAKAFRFELVDTSHIPGVCMNYPVAAAGASAPDLQLTPERNGQPWQAFAGHGQKIETVEGEYLESPPAVISSFDWGATAVLKVEAVLGDDTVIVGHLDGAAEGEEIRLPKRKQGSLIADAWKDANHVLHLPDDDDGEEDPPGDGHSGDGITLFEEYRGFYARDENQHQIGDPRKKDYFIWNWTGRLGGISLFASLSGLNVHARLTGRQVRPDRVINFNHSGDTPHRVDQHAVILLSGALGTDRLGEANGGPGLPREVRNIVVDGSLVPAAPDSLIAIAGRNEKIIAHELFHAANVFHHGKGDLRRLAWTAARQGTELVYQEGGETVMVVFESNQQLITPDDENDHLTVWMGVDQGEHSGTQDCVLRYSASRAYRERELLDRRFYLGSRTEPDGFSLCDSKAGTGVNAPGHSPQSRYGPAGRGCCSHQVCVNDARTHSGSDDPPPDCPAGGGSVTEGSLADSRAPGGGDAGAPLVSLAVNGLADVEVLRGWPVLVEVELVHPEADRRGADPDDVIIAPPGGDWTRAIRFTVLDGTGAEVAWPIWPQGTASGPLVLSADAAAVLGYWIFPEDSAAVPAGSYRVRATLDTSASTQGWIGTAASEPAAVRLAVEPAPLPAELEASKLLHLARFRLSRGEIAAAEAVVGDLLARFPDHVGGHALRGAILEASGDDRAALAAYEDALDIVLAASPEAVEPPHELLQAHQEVQARIVERKLGPAAVRFRRGDFNQDRQLDISDAVAILGYLFLGTSPDPDCLAAADTNGDRGADLSDGIYLLSFLFLGGPEPPPPFAACGDLPAGDPLGCRRFAGCP